MAICGTDALFWPDEGACVLMDIPASDTRIAIGPGHQGGEVKRESSEIMVRHYSIEGRVQGVGFRWFVQREAAQLRLRGWVRNTDDGRVECVVAGDDAQLATLLDLLKKGSRGSRVDRIRVHDLEDAEAEKLGEFQIEDAW